MTYVEDHLARTSRTAIGVRQRRILTALADGTPRTANEVARAIGYPHGSADVEGSLYGLLARGLVQTDMSHADAMAYGYRPRHRRWRSIEGERA